MWIADRWKDYEVLDTSAGEKLEQWGPYNLVRPDPQVIWNTPKKDPGWHRHNGHYFRSARGGGQWEFHDLPETWEISYTLPSDYAGEGTAGQDPVTHSDSGQHAAGEKAKAQTGNVQNTGKLTFNLQPFAFKHTGVFPEQAVNWDWFSEKIRHSGRRDVRVLNLFAYTGGATLAALAAGASVTHVDASKGMVRWAKENAAVSGLADRPVRWLVDDCRKFIEREIRRGNHYDAIIMDPPSYGRGPKGEIWKLEESIFPFIQLAVQILSDQPLFFLINSYTTGLAPSVLTYMISTALGNRKGDVESDEIGLPVRSTGLVLPCGASGRCSWD